MIALVMFLMATGALFLGWALIYLALSALGFYGVI
jgi:hypothetical protein